MAYTGLDYVWAADVDGTDRRIQADGVWLPTFASRAELPAERIILDGDYELASVEMAVPNTRSVDEEETGPAVAGGEAIRPDSTPGTWIELRSAWDTVTENELIWQSGMWPPSNLGVATPLPVRWFGLTDGRSGTSQPTAEGEFTVDYSARLFRTTRNIQVGSLVFSGTRTAPDPQSTFIYGDLFQFRHRDSVNNPDHKGILYLHLDGDNNLTFAVIGESYLPPGTLSEWDMFQGYLESFSIISGTDADQNQRELPVSYDFEPTSSEAPTPVFGHTTEDDAYNVFYVLPVRAEVIRNQAFTTGRFFDRRAAGFLWSVMLTPESGTGDTAEYQDFVGRMRTDSIQALSMVVRWVNVGGVGRDVLS